MNGSDHMGIRAIFIYLCNRIVELVLVLVAPLNDIADDSSL